MTTKAGERRQITVMFVDLVGSTALAEQIEPELVRDVIAKYREICGRAITHHHGYVAQYSGDGIMAFFGFPTAREDDARHAIAAGLDLLAELEGLDDVIDGTSVKLTARVGIHTGLVLVSDVESSARPEYNAVFGAAPNQAARIQSVASDGTVVISDDTFDIVRGYFDVESLGTPEMKGIERPVEVFRVLGPTAAVHRLQTSTARSPFVGRRDELDRLHAYWDLARTGSLADGGRIVVLVGEAGIGKSRLAEVLANDVLAAGGSVLSAFCAADRRASPLYPIGGLLDRRFDLEAAAIDAPARLESGCTALGLDAAEVVPLLLGVRSGSFDSSALQAQDPRVVRERAFAALVALVAAEARRTPTLLLVEDLHWSDESTLELVRRLGGERDARLLIVGTTRPELDPRPVLGGGAEVIELAPLPPDDHRALVEAVSDMHHVPESLRGEIVLRSDGNPLFAEELAKSMIDPSDGRGARPAIPRTIRDLITARLDALGERKSLAQAAAVIGRDIDVALLEEITGSDRRHVVAGLADLEGSGIVERVPDAQGRRGFRFSHSLVRDAAYDSQEQPLRRAVHRRVAETLQQRPAPDPGLVAQHFDGARITDHAVEWYLRAGITAQTSAAEVEAVRQFDRALELVESLPNDAFRDGLEFSLRVARGTSHVNMKGYGAPEAAEDYGRALPLSERVGEMSDIVPATAAIWAYYLVHGDLHESAEAVTRLGAMRSAECEAEILCCEGVQRFFEGRMTEARQLLQASVDWFRSRPSGSYASARWLLPSDSFAVALTHLGCALWLVGDSVMARDCFEAADARARALPAYPTGAFTAAYVSSYAAWISILAGRFDDGRALHEQTTEVAQRYGMLFWVAAGTAGDAIARGHLESPEPALERLDSAMELWHALGAEAFLPFVQARRAALQQLRGEPAAALADVDLALAEAERRGENSFAAETHRLRAAILLDLDPHALDDARSELQTAGKMAGDQGALAFELRAASDLVDLDVRHGLDARASRRALRHVLDAMPAGAEPDDVARAQSLLET